MPSIAGQNPFLRDTSHRRFRSAHVPAQRGIRTHLVFARRLCPSPRKASVLRARKVVMVIVVMIVMALVRPGLRIRRSNKHLPRRSRLSRRTRTCFRKRCTALAAEAIAFAIAISASATHGERGIESETRRYILCRSFRVDFRSRSLSRFNRRGDNRFLTVLGTATSRLKSAVEFFHVSAANGCVHRRSEGPLSFFVFIHESITHYSAILAQVLVFIGWKTRSSPLFPLERHCRWQGDISMCAPSAVHANRRACPSSRESADCEHGHPCR